VVVIMISRWSAVVSMQMKYIPDKTVTV
jgi:hypothetical protein